MYPNYRISVEVILLNEGKVLLTKRSANCKVAPNVWNVPAGKIKYEEIPLEGLVRETKEETNLEIDSFEEIAIRNLKSKSGDEVIYRVIYTYLIRPENNDISSLILNDEHSDLVWVGKDELSNKKYESLHNDLRTILLTKVFSEEAVNSEKAVAQTDLMV